MRGNGRDGRCTEESTRCDTNGTVYLFHCQKTSECQQEESEYWAEVPSRQVGERTNDKQTLRRAGVTRKHRRGSSQRYSRKYAVRILEMLL